MNTVHVSITEITVAINRLVGIHSYIVNTQRKRPVACNLTPGMKLRITQHADRVSHLKPVVRISHPVCYLLPYKLTIRPCPCSWFLLTVYVVHSV